MVAHPFEENRLRSILFHRWTFTAALGLTTVVLIACGQKPTGQPKPTTFDAHCSDAGTPDMEFAQWPIPPDSPPDSEYEIAIDDTTVTDSVTGLIWQRQVPQNPCLSDGNGTCTWADAQSYCQKLSLGEFLTGWRLPTRIELISLQDFGASSPTINKNTFPNTPYDTTYWSSSRAIPAGPNMPTAWVVDFAEGAAGDAVTSTPLHLRCVHSSPTPHTSNKCQYQVSESTVLDNGTQLIWQRQFTSEPTADLSAAQSKCQQLQVAGFTMGWRIPSIKELSSLVDDETESPAIDTTAFPVAREYDWWSLTSFVAIYDNAWFVGSSDGTSDVYFPGERGVALEAECVH